MKVIAFLSISFTVLTRQCKYAYAQTTCIEKGTDKFFFQTKKNDPSKPIFRTCATLATWENKEEVCTNLVRTWDNGNGRIFGPPGQVCKITCGTCSSLYPSASPSSSPSSAPTPDLTTTVDLSCVDSSRSFKYTNSVFPKCKNVENIIRRIDDFCSKPLFASHCPKICDQCEEFKCKDSQVTFLNKEEETRDCNWLRSLNKNMKERKCRLKSYKNTCRETCGYCEGEGEEHIVHFDDVVIDDGFVNYKRDVGSGLYFDHTVAFQRAYYEDTDEAFHKSAFSEPNSGASSGDTKKGIYSEFFCPGGSFDLESILVKPLWNFHARWANHITIKAYDNTGNAQVGEYVVHFSHASEVAKVDFTLNPEFNNLGSVVIESPKEMYHGYDDIKIVTNSACDDDYYDTQKEKVLDAGTMRQSGQEVSQTMWAL